MINGRQHSRFIKENVRFNIEQINKHGINPGLAVLIVGNDAASHIYVDAKCHQSRQVGITSVKHEFSKNIDEQILINCIQQLNADQYVHGILIQLPLPPHINIQRALMAIDPRKDVDGLHPQNLGLLMNDQPYMIPCTPLGCYRLLKKLQPDLTGLKIVIVGCSILIGRPMIHLLLNENCTVTVVHKKTQNIQHECQQADVIITAAGVPKLIDEHWVKPNVIVIDVGINRIIDHQGNSHLVGDADFDKIVDKARAITPVPGGVGPMTVACLLENCIKACIHIHQLPIVLPLI